MKSKQIRELQVSSSQLALIFLGILAVAIIIFLLGVSIGKKYREAQLEVGEEKARTLSPAEILAQEVPGEKKADPGLISEKIIPHEKVPVQNEKTEPEQIKPPEITPIKKAERLDKSEAQVTAKVRPEAKLPKSDTKVYFVQVGAFSKKEASASLVQKLKKAGYQTLVLDPLPTDKSLIYRVRIGPFKSEAEAEAAKNRVKTLIPAASSAFLVRQ